jgi:hypothetical protein
LARELQKKKVAFVIFDEKAQCGGTWVNEGRVPYMSLQISGRHYRFPDFEPPNDNTAAGVAAYMEKYARKHNIWGHIRFSCKVLEAKQVAARIAFLTYMRNKKLCTEKFTHIVYTGHTSRPRQPEVFRNHSLVAHTSALNEEFLRKVSTRRRNPTVIVYGGSKSSLEACRYLRKNGIEVLWLSPKFVTYATYRPGTTLGWPSVKSCLLSPWAFPDCLFNQKVHAKDKYLMMSGNFAREKDIQDSRQYRRQQGTIDGVGSDWVTIDGRKTRCDGVVLAIGYEKSIEPTWDSSNILFIEKCQDHLIKRFGRRIIITGFGIVNAHIKAVLTVDFILKSRPEESAEQYFSTRQMTWQICELILFQIQYLITTKPIQPLRINLISNRLLCASLIFMVIMINVHFCIISCH